MVGSAAVKTGHSRSVSLPSCTCQFEFCCRVLVSGCAEEGRKEGLDRYKHEVDDAMHYSGKLCLFLSQGELIYLSVHRN